MFEGQKKIRQHNLTKSESEALKWLSDRDDIIIKSADKGGAVVVWGKEQYISEALRQLENNQYYSVPPANPLNKMKRELEELLNTAMNQNWISKKEHDYYANIHASRLSTCSPRPIISGNESITEPASKFVDFFIKPFVTKLPSYIQDSTQVLKKVAEIQNILNIGCFLHYGNYGC